MKLAILSQDGLERFSLIFLHEKLIWGTLSVMLKENTCLADVQGYWSEYSSAEPFRLLRNSFTDIFQGNPSVTMETKKHLFCGTGFMTYS